MIRNFIIKLWKKNNYKNLKNNTLWNKKIDRFFQIAKSYMKPIIQLIQL